MVLITAVDENGKVIRKCDARCYNAKGEHCKCVCGGRNHGLGLDAARERILKEREAIVAEHKADEEYGDLEVKIKI
jgi:hypothetical protein